MNNKFESRQMRAADEKLGFRIHRTVYLCVISLLVFINLNFVPGFIWFIFPMIGWGIGLTVHYMNIKNLA